MLFYLFHYFERELARRAGSELIRREAAIVKWVLPLLVAILPAILQVGEGFGFSGGAATAVFHLQRVYLLVAEIWGIWIFCQLWRCFAPVAVK